MNLPGSDPAIGTGSIRTSGRTGEGDCERGGDWRGRRGRGRRRCGKRCGGRCGRGAVAGGTKQRQGNRQQQAQQAEQQQAAATATTEKAFAACMEARSYTVK